jgi:hypothetical protein
VWLTGSYRFAVVTLGDFLYFEGGELSAYDQGELEGERKSNQSEPFCPRRSQLAGSPTHPFSDSEPDSLNILDRLVGY